MKMHTLLALTLVTALGLTACNSGPAQKTSTVTAAEWQSYHERSAQTRQLDQDFFAAELRSLGQGKAVLPPPTREFGFDINQPDAWFTSAEGKRIMDIILSFQTPSGGWSKRTDMAAAPRTPGMAFGTEAKYIPTFDNEATSTQAQLLARAYSLTGNQAYADAFYKAIELIIAAQYPNGGWPQNYPLVGDYHDHITYNDELMENLMSLLFATSRGQNEYAFVPQELRQRAARSLEKGLQAVLDTQVIVNGKRTVWGAQHDAQTLKPAKARAYEMASLSSSESVSLLDFLMDLPEPSAELVNAIHAAMDWYEETKIVGQTWKRGDGAVTIDPAAPPMWSRFYEVGTNRPIFGDRDHSVHYEISTISQERRDGYAWYTTLPNRVLKKYAEWAQRYPRQ